MSKLKNLLDGFKVLLLAATQKSSAPEDAGGLPLMVEANACRYPDAIALICEDDFITWRELNHRANRIASVLKSLAVARGDSISLFMQNRIEFVVQLLAINKLGAIASLINSQLKRHSLAHCISLTNSRKCIFGEELAQALSEVRGELSLSGARDFLYVADKTHQPPPHWASELDSNDPALPIDNHPETQENRLRETACFIFTSGTTGLPKAAVVSNGRMLFPLRVMADMLLQLKRDDRVYNCLPLYHGTGLIAGLMAATHAAASTVIGRRFSVHGFWDDIRRYDCSSFVYIGEFVRYLMSLPERPDDAENPVRAIIGNGLRPDIWPAFKRRFGIARIGEFYAASEGNGGFANVFNKDCTVGVSVGNVKLVRYDSGNDQIVRDQNGHCIEVADGDAGLLLIEVTGRTKFEGYTDAQATERKLVRDAFDRNDLYFNSGDLMKTVDVGFGFWKKHYQFVDRVGDTFRWKGENVSTNEVEDVLNSFAEIVFSSVYGVEIPGTDGRAGMAAIVLREGLTADTVDLAALSAHLCDCLPSYARPIFLRLLDELPTTSTHKIKKQELREQAFHPDRANGGLLVMKPDELRYTSLEREFYDRIMRRDVAF